MIRYFWGDFRYFYLGITEGVFCFLRGTILRGNDTPPAPHCSFFYLCVRCGATLYWYSLSLGKTPVGPRCFFVVVRKDKLCILLFVHPLRVLIWPGSLGARALVNVQHFKLAKSCFITYSGILELKKSWLCIDFRHISLNVGVTPPPSVRRGRMEQGGYHALVKGWRPPRPSELPRHYATPCGGQGLYAHGQLAPSCILRGGRAIGGWAGRVGKAGAAQTNSLSWQKC